MRIWQSVTALMATGGWALAGDCPAPPDHSVAFARLVEEIRAAPDQQSARAVSNRMWALWTDAPDAAAQAMLDRGMARRAEFDLVGALENFDALVSYCPDYAEGYNQRAFVNFIARNYAQALVDLDRALAVSPTHLGALSGRAMTLMALGREAEAQHDLRVAIDLNPWLPERGLLKPEAADSEEPDL